MPHQRFCYQLIFWLMCTAHACRYNNNFFNNLFHSLSSFKIFNCRRFHNNWLKYIYSNSYCWEANECMFKSKKFVRFWFNFRRKYSMFRRLRVKLLPETSFWVYDLLYTRQYPPFPRWVPLPFFRRNYAAFWVERPCDFMLELIELALVCPSPSAMATATNTQPVVAVRTIDVVLVFYLHKKYHFQSMDVVYSGIVVPICPSPVLCVFSAHNVLVVAIVVVRALQSSRYKQKNIPKAQMDHTTLSKFHETKLHDHENWRLALSSNKSVISWLVSTNLRSL